MKKRPTFVYFIATRDRSMVKIGWSAVPKNRLGNLAAWSPLPLDLISIVPGTRDDERAMHYRFREAYSHREWFRATPEMLAVAEELSHYDVLPEKYRGHAGSKGVRPPHVRSPETRAKASAAHKRWWAERKASEAIAREFTAFMAANSLSIASASGLLGRHGCFRVDGSLCVFNAGAIKRVIENNCSASSRTTDAPVTTPSEKQAAA